MKKPASFFKSTVVASLLLASLFSCNKKKEQINYIPKDANIVMSLDVKSIGMKSLDFKELFSIESIKKTLGSGEAKESNAEKLRNSGIDLLNSAYFFGNLNAEKKGYGALTVALSDASKFESFVKELDKNALLSAEGDINFAIISRDQEKITIGWNEGSAIFLLENTGKDDPKKKMLSFFNLQKEETLSETDKNFQSLQKEEADISFWMNLDQLGSLASQYPGGSALNLNQTFLTAVCNFEKGQIVIDTRYHANKETAKNISFAKGSMSKETIEALPSKPIIAMLGLSVDMDKLYAYLEKENMVANVEENAKQSTGLSSKEIFQMLNGEFVATINGVQMKEEKATDWLTGEEVMRSEPNPEYSIVIGINNKEKSEMLLSRFTEQGLLEKKENVYSFQNRIFISNKGSSLIVSGPDPVSSSEAGKVKISQSLENMLRDNAGAFYLDVSSIPEELMAMTGTSNNEYMKNARLESISVVGSPIKNNVSQGKIVIAFKDKDENSLVSLARAAGRISDSDEPATSVMPK